MLAPPIPAKKLSGILITSAHGQLITRNVSARKIHSPQFGAMLRNRMLTSGGRIASAAAR